MNVIHATGAGTNETSYYGPLEVLLNRIGAGLKPSVRAVFQLADSGAGHPDFGLFTADQFVGKGGDFKGVQHPSRGAGEVKGVDEDLGSLATSDQVSRYWETYRQVLVTNLRGFAFVTEGVHGQPIVLERLSLADSAGGFWKLAAESSKVKAERAEEIETFLLRCLRHAAPIETPKDLAWFLASYAREARGRLDRAPLDVLAPLREALEETLGAQFRGEKGDRFFRATVVQTLFYGVFSAWTLWHRENPDRTEEFTWHSTPHYLRVPVLDRLFRELSGATLKKLDLADLLNRTARLLARINRSRFFARFDVEADAIQYFYEPFLEAYDPKLRKDLGVWYTPPEVVRYMVARVDTELRETLGIEDGLADESVVVLDPACGTGTFLVEVLRQIRRTLEAQGGGGLLGAKLKKAATERLFGLIARRGPAHRLRALAEFLDQKVEELFAVQPDLPPLHIQERLDLDGHRTLGVAPDERAAGQKVMHLAGDGGERAAVDDGRANVERLENARAPGCQAVGRRGLEVDPPGGAALLRALSHRDRADLAGVDAAKPEGSLFIAHDGMGSIE